VKTAILSSFKRREKPPISIQRRLVASFVYLSMYLIIVSLSMYAINKRLEQSFSSFTRYSEQYWQLSIQQMQLQERFQQTLRNRDTANLGLFFNQLEVLDSLFAEISDASMTDLESQTLFRVLSNMHAYRINSMTQLLNSQVLSPSDHEEISYLSLQAGDMNRIAQQLATHEQSLGTRNFASFIAQETRRALFVMILLIFFVVVFGMLALRSISRILARTHQLILQAKDLDSQQIQFVASGYKEIDALSVSFLRMRKEISEYIAKLRGKAEIEIALHKEQEENERKDSLLKQAQLDLLRSQINPHFLFNTLNIIGKKVLLQDSEKSLELIEDISQIMRYTLEHKDGFASLAAELEIVESYLNIQKSRYGKRLSYRIESNTETETIMVPPVLLQPLVENCIKYGIEQNDGQLVITLSINTEERYHVIHVIDNGPGFKEGRSDSGHGIGLGNLYKRLALLYKEEALVSFGVPKDARGTDVCIRIPKEEA